MNTRELTEHYAKAKSRIMVRQAGYGIAYVAGMLVFACMARYVESAYEETVLFVALLIFVLCMPFGWLAWEKRLACREGLMCRLCGKRWARGRTPSVLKDGKCGSCGAQLFTFDLESDTDENQG